MESTQLSYSANDIGNLQTDSLLQSSSDQSSIRRKMSKVKPNRFCLNIQQKVRVYVRYVAVFLVICIISYFAADYMQINHANLPIISKDRSETYNVKVIPASLSDVELDKLPKETFSYLTMIDAGSSGCRAHVYRYGKLGHADGPIYVLPQHQSKKVKPGLSSFVKNPSDAGNYLLDLIQFMKEQVPSEDWNNTPVWLKATAGLRMLPSVTSEAILESVRKVFSDKKANPFLFRSPTWARIITGNEEGGFGWIAYNYLKKIIGPKRDKDGSNKKISPYVVIEMGGASAQVSQMAPSAKEAAQIPPEYRFDFTIEEDEYHLYTHSYLGYGAEQAQVQFNKLRSSMVTAGTGSTANSNSSSGSSSNRDPCTPEGYTAASGSSKRRLATSSSLEHHLHRYYGGSKKQRWERRYLPTTTAINSNASGDVITTMTTAAATAAAVAIATTATTSSSSSSGNMMCSKSMVELFTSADPSMLSPPITATAITTASNSSGSSAGGVSAAVSRRISQKCPATSSSTSSSPSFSFNCVYQPAFVTESLNILTFENFFYMSSALAVAPIVASHNGKHNSHHHGGNGNSSSSSTTTSTTTATATVPVTTTTAFPLETTPLQIKEASDRFCSLDWSTIQANYPKDKQSKDVNEKMCFISAFAYSFLVDGLKIAADKVITIQKDVEGNEIEWALGAAYKEAASFLKRTNLRPTN